MNSAPRYFNHKGGNECVQMADSAHRGQQQHRRVKDLSRLVLALKSKANMAQRANGSAGTSRGTT